MIRVDRREVAAPLERVFACATGVEHWPQWLGHYRRVRFLERRADGGGLVEMAAWRPFGTLRWPTRWVSEMHVDRDVPAVRYRHVQGITRGMDVEWAFAPVAGRISVTITHWWDGPGWPLAGRAAAEWIIGPLFIHAIAQRTLAGIARVAEGGGA